MSETAELADVVLPGTVWGEDEGTTTNLEGRVIKINTAAEPPGEARRDWEIACELARRLGTASFSPIQSPREIFDEMRHATKGGEADYFGITYEKIDAQKGVFWPCPTEEHPGTPRLYAERFGFPDGQARFHRDPLPAAGGGAGGRLSPAPDNRPRRLPLSLRQPDAPPAFLYEQAPDPWVEMHRAWPDELGIADGDLVRVRTRARRADATALVVPTIRPDHLFIPFHYGHRRR